jgi:hypothetical protein
MISKETLATIKNASQLEGLLKSERVEKYYQDARVNNSTLGALSNPWLAKWKRDNPEAEDNEKPYLRIGKAVDTILTDPERYDLEFYTFNSKRPYGLMGVFIDNLPIIDIFDKDVKEQPIEWFRPAYEKAGYAISINTVVKNFLSDTNDHLIYYRARCAGIGKSVISSDEKDIIDSAVESIKTSDAKSYFFKSNKDEIIRLFQVPVYFDYEEISCKGLLDLVIIDNKRMTWKAVDLKTTAKSSIDFPVSFKTYRYDRQCAFYSIGLQMSGMMKFMEELGYKYEGFEFIVAPKKKDGIPALIFEVAPQIIADAISGNPSEVEVEGAYATPDRAGINNLIHAWRYHSHTGDWSAPKYIIDNKFRFKLTTKKK